MIKVDDNVVNILYFMIFMAVGEHIGKRKVALLHHYHDGYGNNKSLGLMTFFNRSEKPLLNAGLPRTSSSPSSSSSPSRIFKSLVSFRYSHFGRPSFHTWLSCLVNKYLRQKLRVSGMLRRDIILKPKVEVKFGWFIER